MSFIKKLNTFLMNKKKIIKLKEKKSKKLKINFLIEKNSKNKRKCPNFNII
jgi:hypothetical protein